ncbi:MAG: hypothetical protein GYA34_14575 [Chloroflexi bacterium]|nr:hypothetical protein [Chloroflexota bacterium]
MLAIGIITLGLAFLCHQPARADGNVIYVDADASGVPDGYSRSTAYTNVQDALAVAITGNEIWVAEGVYYPDEGSG